jgi:hypothetical protein
MADKYHSDTQEKIETISYSPNVRDTGDLEVGTETIMATSEASGVENADYSSALTLPAPDDARLIVRRIASRLAVTIDSMTAGHLYCRVYVDQQDADHRLFDEDWNSVGEKLDVTNTHSGSQAAIFDLLRDGLEHTFHFFFWVDSGNAVVSAVELWEGVGEGGTSYNQACLEIAFSGLASLSVLTYGIGTGTVSNRLYQKELSGYYIASAGGGSATMQVPSAVLNNHAIAVRSTVATDLTYILNMGITLRSEQ